MTKEVFDNVQGFISGKAPTAQVFDKIAPADLNEWLGVASDVLHTVTYRDPCDPMV